MKHGVGNQNYRMRLKNNEFTVVIDQWVDSIGFSGEKTISSNG
jgi:hypothetical protein